MAKGGVGYSHLHNGGNDRVYTMGLSLRAMAEVDSARYNVLELLE